MVAIPLWGTDARVQGRGLPIGAAVVAPRERELPRVGAMGASCLGQLGQWVTTTRPVALLGLVRRMSQGRPTHSARGGGRRAGPVAGC
jgi:hypothetical protein